MLLQDALNKYCKLFNLNVVEQNKAIDSNSSKDKEIF